MSPEDPRHGSEAGCREHYRQDEKPCQPCLDAHSRRNNLRKLYPHKRPSIGSQRRIQALQAIGYGRDRIARELGYHNAGSLTYLMRSETMLATTAERIADVYDRLSMSLPQGTGTNRVRTWAKRHGFAPPLAWDDDAIDDPAATPHVGIKKAHPHHEQTDERRATMHDLDAWRFGISEACRRLNVSRDALEAWSYRHGEAEVYSRLVERENYAEKVNGSTAERRAG